VKNPPEIPHLGKVIAWVHVTKLDGTMVTSLGKVARRLSMCKSKWCYVIVYLRAQLRDVVLNKI